MNTSLLPAPHFRHIAAFRRDLQLALATAAARQSSISREADAVCYSWRGNVANDALCYYAAGTIASFIALGNK